MSLLKISLILSLFYAAPAWADYKPATTDERSIETTTVNADGSSVSIYESLTRIETQAAVEDEGHIDIPYNGKTEIVQILEAYTLQADGKKIKVPQSSIRTTGGGSGNKFSETKHKVLIYPDVKVGSQLYLKYRDEERSPPYTGHYISTQFFSPHFRYKNTQINLITNNKLPIQIDTKGMRGGLIKETKTHKHYRYTFKQDQVLPPEDSQNAYSDFAPYFIASSFKDHVELGQAYQAGLKNKTNVTPELQALADNLTVGLTDEKAQVEALYQWVSKNIRYMAIYLSKGGVVPHSAQSIYKNRFGDCKDHVVLLETLLKAKGIQSSTALINSRDAFSLPKLAVQTPFNHVINYIPSLDLYLDSTAQFAPFGTLPKEVMDKPVVLTGLNRLGHTPAMQAKDNRMVSKVDILIYEDGSMQGTSHTYATGAVGIDYRIEGAGNLDYDDNDLVKSRLAPANETGTGKITTTDPFDLSIPFEEKATFNIDPAANFPGPGAMTIPVGIAHGEIARLGRYKINTNLNFPYACYANIMEEHYSLTYPNTTKITRIPADVNYQNNSISYQASYKLTGNKIEVFRRYQSDNPSHVCGAEKVFEKQAFFKVLQRDLKGQVFYE
jgi:transglutaminase-like putative cysteine protease